MIVGERVAETYVIERVLGEGAMGKVLLAHDEALQREVAVKIVSERLPQLVPELARRFRAEALAMAGVRHPNVLPIYAFGEHADRPYFVMQYVAGGSLRDVITREGQLPVPAMLGIFEQVAAGLDAIHAHGLVHRDIKPANVLVGARYEVYLADFGVSEPARPGRVGLGGSPSFTAPEIFERRELAAGLKHASDVYSLAVSAYEALSGAVPFTGDSLDALIEAHRSAPPPALSSFRADLPPRFDDVFACALAKQPQARTPSAGEFVAQLRREYEAWQRSRAPRGRHILVVDDDGDMCELYRVVFECAFEDVDVLTAEDGLVALEVARARLPDLMVVDLNMPMLDGLSLCAAVRDDARLASVPIVVISAALTAEARRSLSALDVDRMLSKPITPRELLSQISDL